MVLVDVIVLSGLYTIRILAGSAAAGVPVSPWLAAFSIFFFLSLAFVKRFSELESLRLRNEAAGTIAVKGRGYRVSDLEQLRSFGTSSGYASVVVFPLYIGNLEAAAKLYVHYDAAVAAGAGAAAVAEPAVAAGLARRAARGPGGVCDHGQAEPAAGRDGGGDRAVGAVRPR